MFCPGGAAAARLRQRANGGVPDRCARRKPEEPRACKVKRVGEAVFLPPFLDARMALMGNDGNCLPCAYAGALRGAMPLEARCPGNIGGHNAGSQHFIRFFSPARTLERKSRKVKVKVKGQRVKHTKTVRLNIMLSSARKLENESRES